MPAHRGNVIAIGVIAAALTISVAAVRGAQVYHVGDAGVTAPVLIKKVNPAYPPEAKKEHVQGEVIFRLQINEEGVPEQIQVVSSVDNRLTQAALQAVQEWRYTPATKDSAPVRIECMVNVVFTLK